MKTMDIVKPPPKTALEAWERWMNRIQCELIALPYYTKKKIEIKEG